MFFVWFLFFFFFLRKESEKLGKQETQRCPCSLVKALRSHLEMLLAVGRQMGQSCAGLSFAWMFLFVEIQLGAIS